MKLKLHKIKNFLKKLPIIIGENAFLISLLFILLSLILGGLVLYNYIRLTQKVEIQIIKEPVKFQFQTYEEVLKIWQEREEKSKEVDLKQYPDLFRVD